MCNMSLHKGHQGGKESSSACVGNDSILEALTCSTTDGNSAHILPHLSRPGSDERAPGSRIVGVEGRDGGGHRQWALNFDGTQDRRLEGMIRRRTLQDVEIQHTSVQELATVR